MLKKYIKLFFRVKKVFRNARYKKSQIKNSFFCARMKLRIVL